MKDTHLTGMKVSTTLAAKIDPTNYTHDVLVTLDLVEQEILIILEILVATAAIIVFVRLVPLHLPCRFKDTAALLVGAGHPGGKCLSGHLELVK